jgi:hypothetical protein
MRSGGRIAGFMLVLVSLAGGTSCGQVRDEVGRARVDGSAPPHAPLDATPDEPMPPVSIPPDAPSSVPAGCPSAPEAATGTACGRLREHCRYGGNCSWFCDCIAADAGGMAWYCTVNLC